LNWSCRKNVTIHQLTLVVQNSKLTTTKIKHSHSHQSILTKGRGFPLSQLFFPAFSSSLDDEVEAPSSHFLSFHNFSKINQIDILRLNLLHKLYYHYLYGKNIIALSYHYCCSTICLQRQTLIRRDFRALKCDNITFFQSATSRILFP
jgi:hypothetical protein